MLTTIDKNLLIASLESALLYAQHSAGVDSLEDLTAQVAALRSAFTADPATVTDAQLETMLATLQALDIPDPAKLSRLLTASSVTDTNSYLAVCSWGTLLNKPLTFPPAAHAHPWQEISSKPTTYPPSAHTHEAQPVAVAWADVSDKPTTFPPAEHTHEAQPVAVTWADVTDKPTTFPPAEHTHPEYVSGGGTASASADSDWALWCPLRWGLAYTLPPEIWSSPRLRVLMDGVVRETEDGCTILYIYDEVAAITASLMIASDGQLTGYLPPVSVYASNTARKITTMLEITPTAITVTVNGVTASAAITRPATAQTALYLTFPGWETITRIGVWTDDPATTAPLILADAEHIDNNVLINQAARHIGAGQYDLTLNAPVVLYQ